MARGVTADRAVRRSCSAGVDHIDLYYQHRVDPISSIEETVGAQWRILRAEKCAISLSEASTQTLERP